LPSTFLPIQVVIQDKVPQVTTTTIPIKQSKERLETGLPSLILKLIIFLLVIYDILLLVDSSSSDDSSSQYETSDDFTGLFKIIS